jgi:hypothetical protein
MAEKLLLPFPILSDPEGIAIGRFDVWDPRERIARPSVIVLGGAGEERYRYVGEDYADRGVDLQLSAILEEVSGDGEAGAESR